MEPIIDHIQITVGDMAVAVPFYDKFLPLLGFDVEKRVSAVIEDHEFHVVEYVHPRLAFAITSPRSAFVGDTINRRKPGAVHHLAFKAESPAEVDRLFSELKEIGAVIVSEPRNYPEYTPQPYYALFFKDLEGIKYEIVCTKPALMPTIRFERLSRDEGPRLRSIRLRALQDAPDAFGTTFEQAIANTAEAWARQVANLPTFIAVQGDRDVAMVRGAQDQQSADTGWLLSMWVAPEVRRTHVGAALVDLVVAWARDHGISRIVLDVADLNAPAIALYEAKGFTPNGKTGSMPPPRQHITEHQRELRLA